MSKVVIIGSGLIGKKRAESIKSIGKDEIVAFCDLDIDKAKKLTEEFGGIAYKDWKNTIISAKGDIAVIATNHKLLPIMSKFALLNNYHVLCEKPLGRNHVEVKSVVKLAIEKNLIYKGGFNHRFHPAILKAKKMAEEGKIGDLMYIRARYGHGGRIGYDKEWRADPEIAGGGELLDQGIHLIDLSRWFLGDFIEAKGMIQTAYWDMKPLEDNGFALLKTKKGQTAFLHASWTQWKNLFSFEVFGNKGYLTIEGLGKSYGPEKLIWGMRKPESGPPDIKTFEFPEKDQSWEMEWKNFKDSIRDPKKIIGSGYDGLKALEIIDTIYANDKSR